MSKRFTKVHPAVWRSQRFAGLASSDAKLLHFYFMTSEHQNSSGACIIPDGYVAADLGWSLPAYRKARDELIAAGLIAFDVATTTAYVERWFKHNPPMNTKHAQGCQRLIGEIESETLMLKVQGDFDEANRSRNPLDEAPAQRGSDRWPVRIGGR